MAGNNLARLQVEYDKKAKEAASSAIIAFVKQGERILDLGTGKGENVFLAASYTGSKGQAVGLDTSPDDLAVARREAVTRDFGYPRVSFVQTPFGGSFPVQSESVHFLVSSSIVAHLSTTISGRADILNEIYRVLAPGGRIVIHDVVIQNTPSHDNTITEGEYEKLLADAGFQEISLTTIGANSDALTLYQIRSSKPGTAPSATIPNVISYWLEAAGPIPKSAPPSLSTEEVASLMKNRASIAVVDVRREQRTGGLVRGSYQLPAQTFCLDLPETFERFKDTEKVVFYCNRSSGRGPRCAAWYQDYLDSTTSEHKSKAYVLQGGAQAWVTKFKDHEDLVENE